MNQIGRQGCILQLYVRKQVRFIVVHIAIEQQKIFIITYHNFLELNILSILDCSLNQGNNFSILET